MMKTSIIAICVLGAVAAQNPNIGLDLTFTQPDFGLPSGGQLGDQLGDLIRDFFSLDNVGQTFLGKLLAWKGDLIQPAALFGLGVFAMYTLFRYIL